MNEAQTWTILGAFVTFMFGTLTMVWYSFTRVLRAEIGGLRGELSGQIEGLRGEMSGQIEGLRGEMSGQIGELRGDMRALSARVDALDTDVQKLVERDFDR